MNKKLLGLFVSLPVAASGIVSYTESASAIGPVFQTGDTLNITTNAGISLTNNPNIPPSVFFAPPNPGENPFALPNTTAADVGFLGDTPISGISNLGTPAFSSCNTGGSVSTVCEASIRSFIADTFANQVYVNSTSAINPSGLVNPNAFIQLVDTNANMGYLFSLRTTTISNPFGGQVLQFDAATCPNLPTLNIGCRINVDFQAFGKVAAYGLDANGDIDLTQLMDWADVSYAYSGPRFTIAGGSGTVADPFLTNSVTNASNIIATIEQRNVPESSTVNSLLAVGAVGVLAGFRKKLHN